MDILYDSRLAGRKIVGLNNYATLEYLNGEVLSSGGNKGRSAYLTGYYYHPSDGFVSYQTTLGVWAIQDTSNNDWQITDERQNLRTYSQSQAQAIVNKIINCNKHILSNNLLCARYADKFTAEQRKQICELQARLEERNNRLLEDGYVVVKETNYPAGYAELAPYLKRLTDNNEAIGVATWVVIVVACVVVASLSTAAYYAYKWYADQAEKDVQFSDELTRILTSKLTEEEYQQLLNETKGIVTKARIKQTLTTSGSTLLWAAIAVAGGYLAWQIAKRV